MIERTRCPFLGLKDDPTTALNYPSQGNFCHHAHPISPINGNYQEQFCLSKEHSACPVFQAIQPQPLPAALAKPSSVSTKPKRMLAFIGIPLLLAGATALALTWNVLGSRIGGARPIPVTSMGASEPGAWSLLVTEEQSTPTISPSLVSTKPSPTKCPLPAGWVPYIVNPTDSLYRLSVIYGVSVEQLQQANCLNGETAILSTQVLYVPLIPTDTPFPTNTPVTVLPTNTPKPRIFPTSTPKPPERDDDPPPPTNTLEPPTPEAQPVKPTEAPVGNDNSGRRNRGQPGARDNDGQQDQDKPDVQDNSDRRNRDRNNDDENRGSNNRRRGRGR